VQEYLNSSLGYRALAKKYEISTKSLIERWIAQYKEFGPEGLSKRSFLRLEFYALLTSFIFIQIFAYMMSRKCYNIFK
ncbi:helix-turn-helix domain-containing protein, partial [Staphylococcus arlettae]|uniref:helix-turn-helix domain-containing protein n=2 Tax=Staphylococcus TaxID=1279 RepID=UPI0028A4F92D